jgi:PAS domain S-box-containing protein
MTRLPAGVRVFIALVIVAGGTVFLWGFPRAQFTQPTLFVVLLVLASLTSAFKVDLQLPTTTGSSMSVSYVVDIAAVILLGPHEAMIIAAVSAWCQSTLNSSNASWYRTLFNMAVLTLTVQAGGHMYVWLHDRYPVDPLHTLVPVFAVGATYFLVNSLPVAAAVALTTSRNAFVVWRDSFAPNAPSYFLGAAAAAVIAAVLDRSGPTLTVLVTAAPLYLTYRVYRGRVESDARKGTILEAAFDSIITMDHKGTITEFNRAAEKTFGYPRAEAIGRELATLIIPPAHREKHRAGLARYVTSSESHIIGKRVELTAMRSDGTEFPIELAVTRIPSDGAPLFTGFIRDITERRALEEGLRQAHKMEAIGRLAGGVAHDFNNILMSIMGCSDLLLLQTPENDPRRIDAAEIKQAVERGAALTRQLLTFSRRQAIEPRRIDLSDVVAKMNNMLKRLIGPEIHLTMVRGEEPVMILADPNHIEQVVMNLVINARDAMINGGRLTVEVGTLTVSPEVSQRLTGGTAGTYARLRVSDTGTGIDPVNLSRLFEPFFTTKAAGKGTGLGLSIVYGIVQQNGGHISVSSELGRGTTFQMLFPVVDAPQVEAEPASASGRRWAVGRGHAVSGSGRR